MTSKIVIITLCFGRRNVLKAFLDNHYALMPRPTICIAGSPGDDCEDLIKLYDNCIYIQRPNLPMGFKANECCVAAKGMGKYYFLTGSDDLITQSLWDRYNRFEGEHLGLKDLYFYNLPTGELLFWSGYPIGRKYDLPSGACNMVSADVMEQMGYRPYLDTGKYPREHDVKASMDRLGIKTHLETMAEMGGIAVDLKNEMSITKWQPGNPWPQCRPVSTDEITDLLPLINSI